jgi:hypothetical protein
MINCREKEEKEGERKESGGDLTIILGPAVA